MRFCGAFDPSARLSEPLFGPPTERRWSHRHLTFSIDTTGCNFNNAGHPDVTPDDVIRDAFREWERASVFTFGEVSTGRQADIPVSFVPTRTGKLGAGGQPNDGFARLDTHALWTRDALLSTVLHETGHSLGLSHAFGGSIMNPLGTDRVTVDAESQEVLHLMYAWAPPQQLHDRATTDHAVPGVTSSTNFSGHIELPRMVWTGVAGDSSIYESELVLGGWTPQQDVPGIGSSHSPALAKIDVPGSVPLLTGLLMAWKGAGDDKNLYWTRNLDHGWEDQRRFPTARSDSRPALANVAGRICIACVGSDDDHNLYWSTYDGNEQWSRFRQANDFQAGDSPALVGVGNRLFMFWKGDGDRFEAFWSVLNVDEDVVWQPARRIEYSLRDAPSPDPHAPPPPLFAIGTGGALSAAQCGDTILLAWRGVSIDDTTYVTVFSDGGFGGPIRILEYRSAVGPAITALNDGILIAWRGTGNDDTIHWSKL